MPIPSGASTGPLKFGGELLLDYARAAIIYRQDGMDVFSVGLAEQHQTSLFDAVFEQFTKAGHNFEANRAKITETRVFSVNLELAAAYAEVQWRMYTALSWVKGRMLGPQTPIMLWPHGFDLSTLWFVDGMNEREDPHINIGFSPGTPDVGQPYVYFYTWSSPEGLAAKLPPNVVWHTGWSAPGGYIKYESFANTSDPEGIVLDAMSQVWKIASDLMKASRR
jgi:hypothetical protein